MKFNSKKALYESIMNDVAKIVKKRINEMVVQNGYSNDDSFAQGNDYKGDVVKYTTDIKKGVRYLKNNKQYSTLKCCGNITFEGYEDDVLFAIEVFRTVMLCMSKCCKTYIYVNKDMRDMLCNFVESFEKTMDDDDIFEYLADPIIYSLRK